MVSIVMHSLTHSEPSAPLIRAFTGKITARQVQIRSVDRGGIRGQVGLALDVAAQGLVLDCRHARKSPRPEDRRGG
jgi:hypothetical protein